MHTKKKRKWTIFSALLFASISLPSFAQASAYYSGTIAMLEAWRTGNVAFTLNTAGVPCNGQFILNKSDPGLKNLYAILLAAKAANTSVQVYTDGCGPAEGYGANYVQVAYLYMN